jgi:hypothetical protein
MPQYTIDLRTRFGNAFGESAARIAESVLGFGYQVPTKLEGTLPQNDSAFAIPIKVEDEEAEYYSALGTPIFDRIVFSIPDANGQSRDYQLALPPLIDLRSSKRIAVTPINDNDFAVDNITGGEVVESWGNAPWDISMRGILVDMVNHKRPLDQVRQLVEVFKANSIIQVSTSRLFNTVGIRNLYITNIDLPGIEGFLDTQPYVITAKSYVPAELILND